jgi:uncharacterized protein (TIGR02001 family)
MDRIDTLRVSRLAAVLATAVAAARRTPALADETDPPKDFTLSGSAAIVTDYRLHGVSQGDKHFAVQASATVTHKSGAYLGVWGSKVWPDGAPSAGPISNST